MECASQSLCVHGQGDGALFTGSNLAVKLDRGASSRGADFVNDEFLVSGVFHGKRVCDLSVLPVFTELVLETVYRYLGCGERRQTNAKDH